MYDSGSQITLVNTEPTTEFVFTKSSAINTVLLLKGKPYFQLATVDAAGAHTTLKNVQTNELLATIKRRTFVSDTIKFANKFNGKSIKIKDWIREGKDGNGYQIWTIETPIGAYIWRKDVETRLALCPATDPGHRVAWLQLPTPTTPYALMLKGGTESFRDEIIASFSFLEQEMRMEEKQYAIADGMAVEERTMMGMYVDTGNFNKR